MSIKSLLQIILFLLIFVIVGGIYYLYFYSGPSNNSEIQNLEKLSDQIIVTEEVEILESITEPKIEKNEEIKINSKKEIKSKNNQVENNSLKNNEINKKKIIENNSSEKNNQIKNLTKEIEYITSNKNGDSFKIFAKYGETNIKDTNILDLKQVNGEIVSSKRSTIFLSSDLANYNYTNQNSKFYNNVKIKYDSIIITCDKLDLNMSDNIAVAYNNVILKDDKSTMKAQIITLDILTKDININSSEKINIITNKN